MALTHSTVVTGTNDGAKQVSLTAWNADHAIDTDGLDLPEGATPAAPAAGHTKIFAKNIGGRIMPAFMGPSGLDSTLQPHVARNRWSLWSPIVASATISAIGSAALTAVGTATASPAWASTNVHTRGNRLDYLVTTAATSAIAGYREATARWRGTDGYHHIFRVSPATGGTVATRRFFCGMAASVAAQTDVQPSSQLSIVGVGYDAADTTWQVMFNDGTGTATKVNTAITRPSTDRPGIYSVMIFVPPGGASASVTITDEGAGTTYSTSSTTDLIVATTAVAARAYHSVGGTSSIVGLSLFGGYIESDN